MHEIFATPDAFGAGALINNYVGDEKASRKAKSRGTKGTPSASTNEDESNATERGAVPAGRNAPRTKSASKEAAEATARPNCTRERAIGPPRFK